MRILHPELEELYQKGLHILKQEERKREIIKTLREEEIAI
jgi:hypothetical protein